MKIEGKFLSFDTELKAQFKHLFPKDCIINYPEKLPIIFEYRSWNPEYVIGSCQVFRDDKGLYLEGEIKDEIPTEINGLGGFYSGLRFNKNIYPIHIIEKADLKYVSVVFKPINEEFRFKVVEEGNKYDK